MAQLCCSFCNAEFGDIVGVVGTWYPQSGTYRSPKSARTHKHTILRFLHSGMRPVQTTCTFQGNRNQHLMDQGPSIRYCTAHGGHVQTCICGVAHKLCISQGRPSSLKCMQILLSYMTQTPFVPQSTWTSMNSASCHQQIEYRHVVWVVTRKQDSAIRHGPKLTQLESVGFLWLALIALHTTWAFLQVITNPDAV